MPTDPDPDPSTVPDLIPTPAWSMRITRTRDGGQFLAFASNIWNAGPSPMVVEGFRRPDSNVMDAYEYFYDGDTPVSRAPVGEFEFDTRDGHHHWHMDQFVQYDLLNADQSQIVRSTKQSFCLVPTDAIDMTVEQRRLAPERLRRAAHRLRRRGTRSGSARSSRSGGATRTTSTSPASRSRSRVCRTVATTCR